jgi:hypothetical protein
MAFSMPELGCKPLSFRRVAVHRPVMGIEEIAVERFACCDVRCAVLAAFGAHPVCPVLAAGRVPGSVVDVRRWVGEGEIPRVLVRTHQIAALVGH